MLINVELAQITPPFGILLYIVRGAVPNTTMGQVNRAALPIILCHLAVMALIVVFPALALWMPAMMAR
jgi:TRAP-type C4-dicarboxylate transport system permease large subunit